MTTRPKSEAVYEKLCTVIPGGVNSPVRSFPGLDSTPMVAEEGRGDTVVDIDGKEYIDYCCSWGPLIHGHAHPKILSAVVTRLQKGTSFGITTEIEEKLAKKIVEHVPSVEKIRFVSSGTEATMTAVRVARGYTKRSLVIKFNGNYHGHSDQFLVQAGSGVASLSSSSSAGIPEEMVKQTYSLPFNDVAGFKALLERKEVRENLAAVILEPVACNMGVVPATEEFMNTLREETEKVGALLIFDEVISGFRMAIDGVQSYYKAKPDLTVFGKIVGGGFPVAAFGGRADVMACLAPEGPVYQAGTLSGNPIAMEAGLQTLLGCEKPGFYEELKRKTKVITEPLKAYIQENNLNACVQEVTGLFTLFFGAKEINNFEEAKEKLDTDRFAEFFRFMFDHGFTHLPHNLKLGSFHLCIQRVI